VGLIKFLIKKKREEEERKTAEWEFLRKLEKNRKSSPKEEIIFKKETRNKEKQ